MDIGNRVIVSILKAYQMFHKNLGNSNIKLLDTQKKIYLIDIRNFKPNEK